MKKQDEIANPLQNLHTQRVEYNIFLVENRGEEPLVRDTHTLINLLSHLYIRCSCKQMILKREDIGSDFMNLSTGLARKLLEKCIEYRFIFAILGEREAYVGPEWARLIQEFESTGKMLFASTLQEAHQFLFNVDEDLL